MPTFSILIFKLKNAMLKLMRTATVIRCLTAAGMAWIALKACGCKPSDLCLVFMRPVNVSIELNDGNRWVDKSLSR